MPMASEGNGSPAEAQNDLAQTATTLVQNVDGLLGINAHPSKSEHDGKVTGVEPVAAGVALDERFKETPPARPRRVNRKCVIA